MSTNASFAPIAFPELGSMPQPAPTGQERMVALPRVTPGYASTVSNTSAAALRSAEPAAGGPDDLRTRPVAVRMTPLAYPELVKDETPELRERARVQGHAAGYAAGRKAATETLAADREALRVEADRVLGEQIDGLQAALGAVRQAAGALNAQTAMSLEGTEESVLAAALEIAGMILGRAITEDREGAAVAALRRALDAAGPVPARTVRLNPADLELVSMVTTDEPGLQLLGDPGIARGDAMVDLPDGVVDACIGSAVERVRRALLGGEE